MRATLAVTLAMLLAGLHTGHRVAVTDEPVEVHHIEGDRRQRIYK